jgi:hypothetical protein
MDNIASSEALVKALIYMDWQSKISLILWLAAAAFAVGTAWQASQGPPWWLKRRKKHE